MIISKENMKLSNAKFKLSKQKDVAIALFLAFIMVASSAFLYIPQVKSTVTNASTASTTVNQAASYGNILQYTWPTTNKNGASDRFSAGPAPNSADIMWRTPIASIAGSSLLAMNGLIYCQQARFLPNPYCVIALDPFTGNVVWNTTVCLVNSTAVSYGGGITGIKTKLFFGIEGSPSYIMCGIITTAPGQEGVACLDANTGQILWKMGDPTSAKYPIGASIEGTQIYSSELKMYYCSWPEGEPEVYPRDEQNQEIDAWNFSNPAAPPTLVWSSPQQGIYSHGDWNMEYGNGMILFGTNDGHLIALNALTGATVWDTNAQGNNNYGGVYYNGLFLHGTLGDYFKCVDATTGAVQWTFHANTFWSYWATGPAAAYGMVYEMNPDGHLYALNVTTGQCVWKYGGAYEGNPYGALDYYPSYPEVADGKVYCRLGTANARNQQTGAYSFDDFACLDANTGKLIWELPIATNGAHDAPIIAYGNLYMEPGISTPGYAASSLAGSVSGIGEVWCIGNSTPSSSNAVNWSMFRGNPAQTAGGGTLPTGPAGPKQMTLKWKFQTGGGVVSSPTIVNGVVYVGSEDKNIYALNANTGSKIWTFTTGYRVYSSMACVNGKVYTGADDGNAYCLDASTGAVLWKDSGMQTTFVRQVSNTVPTIRSSPIVFNGNVYVGTLDGYLYCLNANSGAVNWKFYGGGPIVDSAAVIANDGIYFSAATPYPNGTLYKLNFNGGVIWQLGIPRSSYLSVGYNRVFPDFPSPTVAAGMVFQPDDELHTYGINAATGQIVWNFATNTQGGGGPPQLMCSALYVQGKVYTESNFALAILNASTGVQITFAWLSREVYASPSYAYGKVYCACEEGTFREIDPATGATISYYHPAISIWSSPSLYNGNLYWGALDFCVYCFGQGDLGLTTYGGGTVVKGPPVIGLS